MHHMDTKTEVKVSCCLFNEGRECIAPAAKRSVLSLFSHRYVAWSQAEHCNRIRFVYSKQAGKLANSDLACEVGASLPWGWLVWIQTCVDFTGSAEATEWTTLVWSSGATSELLMVDIMVLLAGSHRGVTLHKCVFLIMWLRAAHSALQWSVSDTK